MYKQENVVEIKDEDERRTEAARFRRSVENCMPACHDDQLLHSFSVRTPKCVVPNDGY
jgi:uncharacterized protein (DUF983 family)